MAVFLFLLMPAGENVSFAATLTRGPYLQQGTENRMVVRWRTATNEVSFVRYGTNFGALTITNGNAAPTAEHTVIVTNLAPGTKYFYQIGDGTNWFAGSTNQFFLTSPPVGTPKPTRIWALGDPGTIDQDQVDSRNAYTAFNGARPTDIWLMLGDNAYDSGTDAEFQAAVFDFYPTYLRNTVLWPTIGNHDAATAQAGPYLVAFTLPANGEAGGVPSGSERYYSFDYANIHFICLDSATSDRTGTGPMCTWLQADLASTTQEWIIAFWHHPPDSKGSHNSDTESGLIQMRQHALPILENYGVDLVLCGHSHGYERSMLLDGHYGLSTTLTAAMKKDSGNGQESGPGAYQKPSGLTPHQGAVYTVAGSSGQSSGGTYDHPVMKVSLELVGSVVMDVLSNRLDLIFLLGTTNIGDSFTIIKAPPSTNPPAAPTGLAAVAVATNQINLFWTDHASDEQGFQLERSTNGVDFSPFAVVGVNVTNRSDIGLAPQQTYHYRVRAYNAAGVSPDSNLASATTPAVTPPSDTNAPAAVTNFVISSITSNRVTLTWAAPGDDGWIGTATSYDVRYSLTQITASNFAAATPVLGEPAPGLAGTAQLFTVNGLQPASLYYFALKTSDEATNVSPISNVPSGVTLPTPGGGSSFAFIIPSNAVWKYLDTGTNLGTTWRGLGFDDSAWASGPAQLGYGNGEATTVSYGGNTGARHITTYFRRHFALGETSLFDALQFSVQRDDGVVVYLNGTEVLRDVMPTTAINYLTLAASNVTGAAETTFFPKPPISPALLVPGDNIVAAEVHQRTASSGDLGFNLELKGLLTPPFARIQRAGSIVALRWASYPGKQYRVQFATNLPPAGWLELGTNITATGFVSSLTNMKGSGQQRFYRIVLVD